MCYLILYNVIATLQHNTLLFSHLALQLQTRKQNCFIKMFLMKRTLVGDGNEHCINLDTSNLAVYHYGGVF